MVLQIHLPHSQAVLASKGDIIASSIEELISQQETTGFWNDKQAYHKNSEVTFEVMQALLHYDHRMKIKPFFLKAFFWFSKQKNVPVDQLSQNIIMHHAMNMNSNKLMVKLLSYQNSDGGWGKSKHTISDIYSTTMAINALLLTKPMKHAFLIKGISFLMKYQNSDGSFGECLTKHGKILETALSILSIVKYQKKCLSESLLLNDSIDQGCEWLLQKSKNNAFWTDERAFVQVIATVKALYLAGFLKKQKQFKDFFYQSLQGKQGKKNSYEKAMLIQAYLIINDSVSYQILQHTDDTIPTIQQSLEEAVIANEKVNNDPNVINNKAALQLNTAPNPISSTPTSNPPVAELEPNLTTEGHWPLEINAGTSSDDNGIAAYQWDFGDNSTGSGYSNKHIFWEIKDYTVKCTVFDEEMQSDTDQMMVHVIIADPPHADAGGPYEAAANGPPAYFNAENSSDDFGIVKYLWDVNNEIDSNGDGIFNNDIDVVGKQPFYTYTKEGTYIATLITVDGAGQSATATTTINVVSNLPPHVICVPWRAVDPTIPHVTYNGNTTRLKGIVRDAGNLTYQWDFGDGSDPYPELPAAVTNKYVIEASHVYPESSEGTPFIASLTVWDENGLSGSDFYYVKVNEKNLKISNYVALDEGLWWVHKNQNKQNGSWMTNDHGIHTASPTASAIHAFEINGHMQGGDNTESPYVESVYRGFNYLFTKISSTPISNQTHGNPDSNKNGIGLTVGLTKAQYPIYQGGIIMDAIASSNTPLAFANTGGKHVNGRFFYDILTDMVDMCAWGQNDAGGWRYVWNGESDNSACQWPAIGMVAAQDMFGINTPQWVKDNNYEWLKTSYNAQKGMFGYTSRDMLTHPATTPSGLVQLSFCDKTTDNAMWKAVEKYIATHWLYMDKNYYAMYTLVKGLKLAKPDPVILLEETNLDWYTDIQKRLINLQFKTGTNWGAWDGKGYGAITLDTTWVLVMLTPSLFFQHPVANAGDKIHWGYDIDLIFDASNSFHMDEERKIIKYEWDFDGDGVWDLETTDPKDPNAVFNYPDPSPDMGDPPKTFTAVLRVTDNNRPPQTDTDTRTIIVAEPPHAPHAKSGGPYETKVDIPVTLDGSGSYDIDYNDSITLYMWDLDNDGQWFNDIDVETQNSKIRHTFTKPGIYNIALKVKDRGVLNPVGCVMGEDCIPLESQPSFAIVNVIGDQPITADAGGPYSVAEGVSITLNGSKSSNSFGKSMSYSWDLDLDGKTDCMGIHPTYTWKDNGSYRISLTVSDGKNEHTDRAIVNVSDQAPQALFDTIPDRQKAGKKISFIDKSKSLADRIVAWSWDFDGKGASNDQHPTFDFQNKGQFVVTLTVTDDDGSISKYQKLLTVEDSKACEDCDNGIFGNNCFIDLIKP